MTRAMRHLTIAAASALLLAGAGAASAQSETGTASVTGNEGSVDPCAVILPRVANNGFFSMQTGVTSIGKCDCSQGSDERQHPLLGKWIGSNEMWACSIDFVYWPAF